MKRMKVVVRWDDALEAFAAFDPNTGERLPTYSRLNYGDTAAAQLGAGDDPAEAMKTFVDPEQTIDVTTGLLRIADTSPAKAATIIGWAWVPDDV